MTVQLVKPMTKRFSQNTPSAKKQDYTGSQDGFVSTAIENLRMVAFENSALDCCRTDLVLIPTNSSVAYAQHRPSNGTTFPTTCGLKRCQ